MQFTFEKISEHNKQRILADVGANRKLSVEFIKYGEVYWLEEPTWAIDGASNTYFIRAPRFSERGSLKRNYYIFSDATWFKPYRTGPFSHEVAIEGQDQIPPAVLTRLKEEIRAAFKVFGADGGGPGNSPASVPIVPVFVAETK